MWRFMSVILVQQRGQETKTFPPRGLAIPSTLMKESRLREMTRLVIMSPRSLKIFVLL